MYSFSIFIAGARAGPRALAGTAGPGWDTDREREKKTTRAAALTPPLPAPPPPSTTGKKNRRFGCNFGSRSGPTGASGDEVDSQAEIGAPDELV